MTWDLQSYMPPGWEQGVDTSSLICPACHQDAAQPIFSLSMGNKPSYYLCSNCHRSWTPDYPEILKQLNDPDRTKSAYVSPFAMNTSFAFMINCQYCSAGIDIVVPDKNYAWQVQCPHCEAVYNGVGTQVRHAKQPPALDVLKVPPKAPPPPKKHINKNSPSFRKRMRGK